MKQIFVLEPDELVVAVLEYIAAKRFPNKHVTLKTVPKCLTINSEKAVIEVEVTEHDPTNREASC